MFYVYVFTAHRSIQFRRVCVIMSDSVSSAIVTSVTDLSLQCSCYTFHENQASTMTMT